MGGPDSIASEVRSASILTPSFYKLMGAETPSKKEGKQARVERPQFSSSVRITLTSDESNLFHRLNVARHGITAGNRIG